MIRQGLRIPGFAVPTLVWLLVPPATTAKTYDLRYRFRVGEAFAASLTVSASGTIASPTASAPFRTEGRILRQYRVTRIEEGETAVLEPLLESATFDISVGTAALRVSLTPTHMEVNGQVLWKAADGPPNVKLLPFLRPPPIRLDPWGRKAVGPEEWQQVAVNSTKEVREGFHAASEVVSLLAGEREVFPSLPERPVQEGDTWLVRIPLARTPQGADGLVRSGTYTLRGSGNNQSSVVDIQVVERVAAQNEPAILIQDLFRRPVVGSAGPTPTPRVVDRETIVFEHLDRSASGEYRFDVDQGRLLWAHHAGTETISAATTRKFDKVPEAMTLLYSYALEVRAQFEYPDQETR